MADLKQLLGENYKDEMTPEQVVDAIKQNDKLVNLSNGEYVAKGKFDDLSAKYSKTMEETKDYDDFKKQAEEYKTYKKNVTLKEAFKKSGIKDEFLDYAIFQVEKGAIVEDDKFDNNVKEWVKSNPVYANIQKDDDSKKDPIPKKEEVKKEPEPKPKVIVGKLPKDDNTLPKKDWNKWNR